MKALDFPLLADENVHPDVIVFLREAGLDVESVSEQGKFGLPDIQVLVQATQAGRVVLTHDSDFGGLALMGAKFIGIVYVRPGHIHALYNRLVTLAPGASAGEDGMDAWFDKEKPCGERSRTIFPGQGFDRLNLSDWELEIRRAV